MKKAKKVVLIVLSVIIGLGIVLAGLNGILTFVETKTDKHYGQLVDVNGKSMNVYIKGTSENTIVLLSGFGTSSPVLDFMPLIDKLSTDFKVVAVEPFGYGYSDIINDPRTVENITSELHTCLQKINVNKYILMPHSISGLYSLYYINKYRDEVTALIGLDSSVPALPAGNEVGYILGYHASAVNSLFRSLGLLRIESILNPGDFTDFFGSDDPAYTPELLKQYEHLALKNTLNRCLISQSNLNKENIIASNVKLPSDLPVLFFLSTQFIEQCNDNTGNANFWLSEHEKLIADSKKSKIIILDASHYVHHTKSAEIKSAVMEFLSAPSK